MQLPGLDRLHASAVPASPRGLVLMLHGGAEHGHTPVTDRNLSLRRSLWMFETISGRLVQAGLAVALVRFRVKGWNEGHAAVPQPVTDTREVLDAVRRSHADLPVVLLGHSMGARTAAWVADDPSVIGVVGLAPWFPADDPVVPLTGKHLVAAHGRRDRITRARSTATFVRRADEVTASARFLDMGAVGHYMLAGVRRWNATAIRESIGIVDGVSGITSDK